MGKRCMMMSAVEPSFGLLQGSPGVINGLKYFTFNNTFSEPSDKDGKCKFKDLSVTGGITSFGYLLISVDGMS